MITKVCTLALLLASTVVAKDFVENEIEEVDSQHPVVDKAAWKWVVWSMGFLLGVMIELGTNVH